MQEEKIGKIETAKRREEKIGTAERREEKLVQNNVAENFLAIYFTGTAIILV